MAYRNKTYVAFDGDKDIHYYYLMKAWHSHKHHEFNFYNAHDLNSARDSSQEESIKRQLKERLLSSKLFVLLVGESTRYLHKFVLWEMEQAVALGLPIVVVNLNGSRQMDSVRCPPFLQTKLAIHIPFKQAIFEYAFENWPSSAERHRREGNFGPYFYQPGVYQRLGIS